jgi:hypothetical protein
MLAYYCQTLLKKTSEIGYKQAYRTSLFDPNSLGFELLSLLRSSYFNGDGGYVRSGQEYGDTSGTMYLSYL